MSKKNEQKRPVAYYIFRTKITVNGEVFYAKDFGHKAFRIPIYKK